MLQESGEGKRPLIAMEEKAYRALVKEAFDRIERAFEEVDPDIVECENSQGAITITLSDKSRIVVSPQPHVRQIWLAVATQGKAYHFDFNADSKRWTDDKTHQIELFHQIREAVSKATKVDVKI
jgi:iron donor protein CyaY